MYHTNSFVDQQQSQQQQQQREKLPSFLYSASAANQSSLNRPSPSSSFANTATPSAVTTPGEHDAYNDDPNANSNPWPFATPQSRHPNQPTAPSHGIAFNDRLRTDHGRPPYMPTNNATPSAHDAGSSMLVDSDATMNASAVHSQRVSSRLPPSKSLLDSGSPSVMHLRTPSSATAATPYMRSNSTPFGQTPNNFTTPNASFTPRTAPLGSSPQFNGASNADPNASTDSLNRWLTVFGFSGSDSESQALRDFRRHGDIVRTVPGKGNWIHILYRTHLQAQVALYRPWRILTGTDIMIGVVPCTEPEVAKSEDESIEKGFLLASPAANPSNFPSSSPPANNSLQSPAIMAKLKSTGTTGLTTPSDLLRRSGRASVGLAASPNEAGDDNFNTSNQPQNIVQTPQRQSSILEYLSGFYKM